MQIVNSNNVLHFLINHLKPLAFKNWIKFGLDNDTGGKYSI
jgi:hypothetical protein